MIERAVGTAPNADLREADDATPFDHADEHRVISCYCCTCGETATIYAEPGRSREWSHARREPTHTVDYWRDQ